MTEIRTRPLKFGFNFRTFILIFQLYASLFIYFLCVVLRDAGVRKKLIFQIVSSILENILVECDLANVRIKAINLDRLL